MQSAWISHGAISSSDVCAENYIKLILGKGVNLEIWNNIRFLIGYENQLLVGSAGIHRW